MKCPKCGYNSFEYYDICKKCSSDLTGYKQTHSISSMLLPREAKEDLLAVDTKPAESASSRVSDSVEIRDDMFSFGLPEDSPTTTEFQNDDPFNFDEPLPDVKQSSGSMSEGDDFANLLESTLQSEKSPFTDDKGEAFDAPPAAVKHEDVFSGTGEFNLDSFSWDDAASEAPADSAETSDDFDSLFGDTKENGSK